jgi:hypothetical protein
LHLEAYIVADIGIELLDYPGHCTFMGEIKSGLLISRSPSFAQGFDYSHS